MPLTKRQKRYREYLKTDHWKALRKQCFDRDGWKCVRCPSVERIQPHHKFYRGRMEDTQVEDLETLCRECHRKEHGFGPTDFERKARKINRHLGYMERPPVSDWKELRELMFCREDMQDFADLMFRFVRYIVANEREGSENNWWMNQEKNLFWFRRAHRVRQSILERIK